MALQSIGATSSIVTIAQTGVAQPITTNHYMAHTVVVQLLRYNAQSLVIGLDASITWGDATNQNPTGRVLIDMGKPSTTTDMPPFIDLTAIYKGPIDVGQLYMVGTANDGLAVCFDEP